MKRSTLAICLAACAALGAPLHADPVTTAPAADSQVATQDDAPRDLLGAPYENHAAGLSLRIPAGCHRVRETGSGDDLGQFADEKRNWQLKLNRIVRDQPTSLTSTTNNYGQAIPGLLDITVARLKHDLPGCDILRSDMTNISDGSEKLRDNVGMIAVRYAATGGSRYLTQQAIIQSNDRLFYLLALTTPCGVSRPTDSQDDPAERAAVDTFRQLLDSVHLLDVAKIKQEQDERLWRTKNLMTSWHSANRLRNVLIDEQWIRILRNGKDIGYSYVTEQTAAGIPRPLRAAEVAKGMSDRDLVQPGDGILIGVRARTIDPDANVDPSLKPKGPVQVDSATWMFTSADQRIEDWSRVIVVDAGNKDKDGKPIKTQTQEFGTSNKTSVTKLDKNGVPGTAIDPHQPPVRIVDQYALDVTTVSPSSQAEPLNQQVPPWYIPQALSHLLPRLVPLHPEMDQSLGTFRLRSYMFAVYVPEVREVMERYIDVKDPQMVEFAGRKIMAVPVEDRLGWQGSPTIHYVTTGGVYLGSENKEAHMIMLPSDAKTLLSIWKNADLTRPHGSQRPKNNFQGLPLGSASGSQETPTR